VNRSKRSLVLDLKKKRRRRGALNAWSRAPTCSCRTAGPARWSGSGSVRKQLLERNPRLVYVSISGFGETGPYAHKRVYDPIVQGMSGLCDIQGAGTGPPGLVRVIVPDKVTALTAAQNITAALLARERTGVGQHVRLAMLDAVIAFVWPEGMAYHTFIGEGRKDQPVPRRDLVFQTKGRTHDRVDGRAPRVPGLLPRGRQAGVARGPRFSDHGRAWSRTRPRGSR
jgi:crotonobetainyl-CoA:carnitine CoA-transferase CaiB-like acyl-CoA transferase